MELEERRFPDGVRSEERAKLLTRWFWMRIDERYFGPGPDHDENMWERTLELLG